jgi:putative ABC transport system permease protein
VIVRRALWRIARADIVSRPAQSALLLLVVVVAAAGITAGLGQQKGAASQWRDAIARSNGADVAIYGNDRAALAQVAADPAVSQASAPVPISNDTNIVVGSERVRLPLRGLVPSVPVGHPLIAAGRNLDPSATDEIVLERSFALAKAIHVGDTVTVIGSGGPVQLRVVGQTIDTIDCFYPQCGSQFGWVSPSTVDRLQPAIADPRVYLLLLKLHDRNAVGSFASAAFERYRDALVGVNDWKDTEGDALAFNNVFAAFLSIFAVVLLVAAGLVVLSSVMARVLARYREIGILKAVGLTPRGVSTLILGEHVAMAAGGVIVGFVIGCLLAPSMALRMAQVLGRTGLSFPLSSLVVTLVVVEVLVAGATVLPAWRAGRIPTSRAITQGAAPPRLGASRLASLASRAHLGPPVVSGVKDATARPLRTVLTVATLVVTVIAVVVTFGFQRTVDRLGKDPAVLGDPYDVAVVPQGASRSQIEASLADGRVSSWFTATSRRGSIGGGDTFQVRALGGDVAHSGFVVRSGRMLRDPTDVLVGYGLLRHYGLHVGDRITMTVGGVPLPFNVVGWYSETEDSGEIAQITIDALHRAEPSAVGDVVYVRLHRPSDQRAVHDLLVARLGDGARVEIASADTSDLDAFRAAFFVVTLLVLAVGLVNLVATTLLGIRERIRDLAVLKAVGFTPRQVAASVATSTGTVGLAAVVVGIPLGLGVDWLMMRAVGGESGMGPGIGVAPPLVGLLLLVPIAVALTAGVGALASRGAARAQVAEVLRAE